MTACLLRHAGDPGRHGRRSGTVTLLDLNGTVTAVRGVDAKLAAARLAGADVVFAPGFPAGAAAVTRVLSHRGRPTADRPIGDWLNTLGFEAAGRTAATRPGLALVQIDDVRQALAWLCGRTGLGSTCALADAATAGPLPQSRTPESTKGRSGVQLHRS